MRNTQEAKCTITKNSYLAHTDPIFAELKILPFSKLITFAQIKLVKYIFHKYSPTPLITFFWHNESMELTMIFAMPMILSSPSLAFNF